MTAKLKMHHRMHRRALLVAAAQGVAGTVLAGRLYGLQLYQGEKYKTLSDDNRIRMYPILPVRGDILDRNGVIVAESSQRFQLLYSPVEVGKHTVLEEVIKLMDVPDEEIMRWYSELDSLEEDKPLLLKNELSWEEVSMIESRRHKLPGVFIQNIRERFYPYRKDASQWLGYVSKVSDTSQVDPRILRRYPDVKVGKAGLEKVLEEELRGIVGNKQMEVDARGSVVRVLEEESPVSGGNINTTIDIRLQQHISHSMAGKGGLSEEGAAVCVLDIKSGDVLAMVSTPAYDPNNFVRGISRSDWSALTNHPDSPMLNKTISEHYSPGSTFKMVVAIAGLKYGVISPEETIYCNGKYNFAGRNYHCWLDSGHGNMDMRHAIAKSCNVYFYELAKRLGIERIAAVAEEFGFGEATGIELLGEKQGVVPTNSWKLAHIGERWYQGETLSVGIGQGYMLVTPLQLAVMTARLASKGEFVEPSILKSDKLARRQMGGRIDIPPWLFDPVLEGMDISVNDVQGIIHRQRLKYDDWKFAAKTGTVQVRNRRFGFGFVPKENKLRHHSICVGFAPVHDPKYAVSVLVEHGGAGSAVAAPAMKEVMEKIYELDNGLLEEEPKDA